METRRVSEERCRFRGAKRDLQVLLIGRDGQAINTVIFFVAAVAGNTRVLDVMTLELGVETLPKFFVLDGNEFLAFLAFPAVGFPFWHPLGHAFANVNAIGKKFDTAGALEF